MHMHTSITDSLIIVIKGLLALCQLPIDMCKRPHTLVPIYNSAQKLQTTSIPPEKIPSFLNLELIIDCTSFGQ